MSGTQNVVWKYVLPPGEDLLEVEVPALARVVLFGFQRETLAVWIERPQADVRMERRVFRVVGTGHPFPAEWAHRGSAMTADGAFVFHLFETVLGRRA